MKKVPATVFMVLLLLLCFSTARAQGFPWDDFERRTLQELVKTNMEEDAADLKGYPHKGQFVFRGKILPSVVRVIYTGKSKPIDTERKKFIELWAGTYSDTPNYASFFDRSFCSKKALRNTGFPLQSKLSLISTKN